MTHWIAYLAALFLAALTAAILSRRDRAYRPAVAALAWGLAVDVALGRRDAWGLWTCLDGRSPYQGADVWLYHLATALETSWPAAVAALAWWALRPQKAEGPGFPSLRGVRCPGSGTSVDHALAGPEDRTAAGVGVKAIGVSWVAANVALILAWPIDRDGAQREMYTVELLSIGAAFLGWRFRRLTWTPVQRTALWLVVAEMVVTVLGPFRTSVWDHWHVARVAYLAAFAALAVIQVRAWRGQTWRS